VQRLFNLDKNQDSSLTLYNVRNSVIIYMSHNLLILEKFLAHSLLTFSIASVFLQDEASSYRNMLLALVKGN